MARLAASMVNTANYHLQAIAITMCRYAWLSTMHLKIPSTLSCKLTTHFVGLFPVLLAIGPVSFQVQLPNDWFTHNAFHAIQLQPALSVEDAFATPFHPETDNSGEFKVQDIEDSSIVTIYS